MTNHAPEWNGTFKGPNCDVKLHYIADGKLKELVRFGPDHVGNSSPHVYRTWGFSKSNDVTKINNRQTITISLREDGEWMATIDQDINATSDADKALLTDLMLEIDGKKYKIQHQTIPTKYHEKGDPVGLPQKIGVKSPMDFKFIRSKDRNFYLQRIEKAEVARMGQNRLLSAFAIPPHALADLKEQLGWEQPLFPLASRWKSLIEWRDLLHNDFAKAKTVFELEPIRSQKDSDRIIYLDGTAISEIPEIVNSTNGNELANRLGEKLEAAGGGIVQEKLADGSREVRLCPMGKDGLLGVIGYAGRIEGFVLAEPGKEGLEFYGKVLPNAKRISSASLMRGIAQIMPEAKCDVYCMRAKKRECDGEKCPPSKSFGPGGM